MALSPDWRNFRRMQDLTLGFAAAAFVADAILAWPLIPAETGFKLSILVFFPAVYLIGVTALTLSIRPLRDWMTRFVWMSFKAGFGQTVISVLVSIGMLCAITVYTYWASLGAAEGGPSPAGAFSGFGAGIGILIVQTVLTHRLQHDPEFETEVED